MWIQEEEKKGREGVGPSCQKRRARLVQGLGWGCACTPPLLGKNKARENGVNPRLWEVRRRKEARTSWEKRIIRRKTLEASYELDEGGRYRRIMLSLRRPSTGVRNVTSPRTVPYAPGIITQNYGMQRISYFIFQT